MSSPYPYLILPSSKNYFHTHKSQLEKTDYKPYTKSEIFKAKYF